MSKQMRSDHFQNKKSLKREALTEISGFDFSNTSANVINSLLNTLIPADKNYKVKYMKVA